MLVTCGTGLSINTLYWVQSSGSGLKDSATNGKGRSDGSRKEGKDNNGFIADWGSRKTTGYHLYVLGRISGQSCLVV